MNNLTVREIEIVTIAMHDLVKEQWKRVAASLDCIDQSNRHVETGEMIITHNVNANYSRAIEMEVLRDKFTRALEVRNAICREDIHNGK